MEYTPPVYRSYIDKQIQGEIDPGDTVPGDGFATITTRPLVKGVMSEFTRIETEVDNLVPENVAKDVNILGIVGTLDGGAGGTGGTATADDIAAPLTATVTAFNGDIIQVTGKLLNMQMDGNIPLTLLSATAGEASFMLPVPDQRGAIVNDTNTFVTSDPDFIAANIRSGTNVFGLVGTLEPASTFSDYSVPCTGVMATTSSTVVNIDYTSPASFPDWVSIDTVQAAVSPFGSYQYVAASTMGRPIPCVSGLFRPAGPIWNYPTQRLFNSAGQERVRIVMSNITFVGKVLKFRVTYTAVNGETFVWTTPNTGDAPFSLTAMVRGKL